MLEMLQPLRLARLTLFGVQHWVPPRTIRLFCIRMSYPFWSFAFTNVNGYGVAFCCINVTRVFLYMHLMPVGCCQLGDDRQALAEALLGCGDTVCERSPPPNHIRHTRPHPACRRIQYMILEGISWCSRLPRFTSISTATP
jgi:hypothetical protein